jgi:hypothetical protein
MALGDLCGLLKALEDGITALLGLTRGGEDAAPIEAHDLSVVLKHRYQLPRQGGDPIEYALSGSTRLALASG